MCKAVFFLLISKVNALEMKACLLNFESKTVTHFFFSFAKNMYEKEYYIAWQVVWYTLRCTAFNKLLFVKLKRTVVNLRASAGMRQVSSQHNRFWEWTAKVVWVPHLVCDARIGEADMCSCPTRETLACKKREWNRSKQMNILTSPLHIQTKPPGDIY